MIWVVYDLSPPPSLYTGTVNSTGLSPLLPPPLGAASRPLASRDASAWYAMVQWVRCNLRKPNKELQRRRAMK